MAAYSYPIIKSANSWYALYVRSRHEKVVEDVLRGKGYSAFSPGYRVRRKYSDRTVDVEVPLFPGYVFCQFDAARRLPILTTPGVTFVVSTAGAPQAIEAHEIASLQTIVASGRPVQPWPFLKEGQQVRVQAGPLSGALGTLVRVKNDARLIVSVTLLQRSVAVEIDQDSAAPVF
jgi:transcription antitermination factor NusG